MKIHCKAVKNNCKALHLGIAIRVVTAQKCLFKKMTHADSASELFQALYPQFLRDNEERVQSFIAAYRFLITTLKERFIETFTFLPDLNDLIAHSRTCGLRRHLGPALKDFDIFLEVLEDLMNKFSDFPLVITLPMITPGNLDSNRLIFEVDPFYEESTKNIKIVITKDMIDLVKRIHDTLPNALSACITSMSGLGKTHATYFAGKAFRC